MVRAFVDDDWKKTKKKVRSGKFEGTPPWRGVKDPTEFEEKVEDIGFQFLRKFVKKKGLAKPDAWRTAYGETEHREGLRLGGFHCENLLFRHNVKKEGSSEKSPPELVILDW